jgi:hypothetical protein
LRKREGDEERKEEKGIYIDVFLHIVKKNNKNKNKK